MAVAVPKATAEPRRHSFPVWAKAPWRLALNPAVITSSTGLPENGSNRFSIAYPALMAPSPEWDVSGIANAELTDHASLPKDSHMRAFSDCGGTGGLNDGIESRRFICPLQKGTRSRFHFGMGRCRKMRHAASVLAKKILTYAQ